jgi:hypothetical protein
LWWGGRANGHEWGGARNGPTTNPADRRRLGLLPTTNPATAVAGHEYTNIHAEIRVFVGYSWSAGLTAARHKCWRPHEYQNV